LRTTDNTTTLAVGHAYYNAYGINQELMTYIEIISETTFRIEHFVRNGTYGGGVPVSDGEDEVYLTIRIVKITADKCH
jgi:hypothetical protein